MNKEEQAKMLCEKIKEIEKEQSKNYLGQITASERKQYEKDVIGRILAALDDVYTV